MRRVREVSTIDRIIDKVVCVRSSSQRQRNTLVVKLVRERTTSELIIEDEQKNMVWQYEEDESAPPRQKDTISSQYLHYCKHIRHEIIDMSLTIVADSSGRRLLWPPIDLF